MSKLKMIVDLDDWSEENVFHLKGCIDFLSNGAYLSDRMRDVMRLEIGGNIIALAVTRRIKFIEDEGVKDE